tara:strand:+ start:1367 stop:1798 length:432 start_codon:yes stop_codon:yes gene_type:complete
MLLIIIIFILVINVFQLQKKEVVNDSSFEIRESSLKGAGRGLFATKNYKEGDIIEVCPTVLVDNDMDGGNLITHYLFSSHSGDETLVAFGYCSLINHSEEKWNCTWEVSEDDKLVKMFAIKDIQIGEEFFSHYGDEYWRTIDL